MKKIFSAVLCALTLCVSVLGVTACGGKKSAITVYTPDGAPAIAMAQLMSENPDLGETVEYYVVNSTEITSHVTYNDEAKNSDLCVLPVNAASKLLGTGEKYQMLGTVTHGNLYLLKREAGLPSVESIEDLQNLVGKTVGVVQLANVPGLTFKAILNNNGIPYSEVGNDGAPATDKVNLKAYADATTVTPAATDCDYFVVPEPAATTKTSVTTLETAGSLQQLYGGADGYPQAVLVAKKSLIESKPTFISKLMNALDGAEDWLKDANVTGDMIYSAIDEHYAQSTPSFSAAQLSKEVIYNCAIYFMRSVDCKAEVIAFIDDLIAVDASSAKKVSDDFFYLKSEIDVWL